MFTVTSQQILDPAQRELVRGLWNREYPADLELPQPESFEQYLESLSKKMHYLVTDKAGDLKGWGITFDREDGRWFAIILDGASQGKGIGSEVLERMKNDNEKLLGWVIDHEKVVKSNGQPYVSPLPFYQKNGFRTEDARLELPTLSAVKIGWANY